MEYYINPSWIYWINIVGSLKGLFIASAIISGGIAIFSPAFFVEEVIEEAIFRKIEIICFSSMIVSILIAIFVPSKEMLIEMEVAKLATRSNIEWTIDSVKNVVDYIIESIGKLK